MTDLHTHILPGIDDGAKNVAMSLEMLRMEKRQGVDMVALTPHFYRDRENPAHFLKRRNEAAAKLAQAVHQMSEEERKTLPSMALGAEVAWVPNMNYWDELPELCIGKGKYLLVELPFSPWNDQMIGQLYDLQGRTGITPIIAHLERYWHSQKPEMVNEVLSLGVPIQITAEVLLHPLRRGRVMKMLRQGQVHLLASDCHDTAERKPDLAAALEVVEQKLGRAARDQLSHRANTLLVGADG